MSLYLFLSSPWIRGFSEERSSMKFEKGFVRSKVARRILVGFISCAILPVSGLALISYGIR